MNLRILMTVSPGTSTCREDHEHEQACCLDERGGIGSRQLRACQPREVCEPMFGEARLRGLQPAQPGVAYSGLDRPCLHVVLAVLRDNRGQLSLRRLVSPLGERPPAPKLARFPLEFPPRAEHGRGKCSTVF